MSASRWWKAGAIFALAVGLVLAAGYDDLAQAGKAEDAKKALEQLKTAKEAKKKVEALNDLGKLGQIQYAYAEEAVPSIYKALDDTDADVRAAAAKAIGMIGPEGEEVVTKLTELIKGDKEESVQIAATQGLAYLGDRASGSAKELRAIKKGLSDPKGKFGKAIDNTLKSIVPAKKNG